MGETVTKTNHGLDTRERILDAAETLFIEHGYAATSLRAIASSAGVNLAATNYHFGSKSGLLAATFHRRIGPINERRLLLLHQLKASERLLTVRFVLEAFFDPLIQAAEHQVIPALVGRLFGEPESLIKPLIETEFSAVSMAFQSTLSELLPNVSTNELRWRFHFMIGSMIHLLQFNVPLGNESTHEKFIEGISHLIDFSIAGLAQSDNRQSHD